MPVCRHTAFPHRLRFFQDRRFPVILEEDNVVAGLLLHRLAGAGQDFGFRLADDFLLIRIFADGGRCGATGDGYQSEQAGGKRQQVERAGLNPVRFPFGG